MNEMYQMHIRITLNSEVYFILIICMACFPNYEHPNPEGNLSYNNWDYFVGHVIFLSLSVSCLLPPPLLSLAKRNWPTHCVGQHRDRQATHANQSVACLLKSLVGKGRRLKEKQQQLQKVWRECSLAFMHRACLEWPGWSRKPTHPMLSGAAALILLLWRRLFGWDLKAREWWGQNTVAIIVVVHQGDPGAHSTGEQNVDVWPASLEGGMERLGGGRESGLGFLACLGYMWMHPSAGSDQQQQGWPLNSVFAPM